MAATRPQLRSWLLRVAAAALGAQLLCAPAKAQRIVASPEYDAMFAQVLREPANLDLSFRFAEVATAAGDYEAAIGALERMLFYNPALPRVRLELGILYFRLGSYEMARSYLAGALAGADAPPEVRARVEPFLFEIDRRLATTQWSGFGQLGVRFQDQRQCRPDELARPRRRLRRHSRSPLREAAGLEPVRACRRAPHPRFRQPARRCLGDEPRRLRGAPVQDRAARSRARRDPDRAASRAHARPVGRLLDPPLCARQCRDARQQLVSDDVRGRGVARPAAPRRRAFRAVRRGAPAPLREHRPVPDRRPADRPPFDGGRSGAGAGVGLRSLAGARRLYPQRRPGRFQRLRPGRLRHRLSGRVRRLLGEPAPLGAGADRRLLALALRPAEPYHRSVRAPPGPGMARRRHARHPGLAAGRDRHPGPVRGDEIRTSATTT